MGSADKKLKAMRDNPQGDWNIEDLYVVARDRGLKVRNPGGSHHFFSHPDIQGHLSVPAHRPIKSVYIRKFVELIDKLNDRAADVGQPPK